MNIEKRYSKGNSYMKEGIKISEEKLKTIMEKRKEKDAVLKRSPVKELKVDYLKEMRNKRTFSEIPENVGQGHKRFNVFYYPLLIKIVCRITINNKH